MRSIVLTNEIGQELMANIYMACAVRIPCALSRSPIGFVFYISNDMVNSIPALLLIQQKCQMNV